MRSFIGHQEPWSYDQVQRKRALANAMASQIGSPRSVGEGLSALGKALAARGMNKRADARESELREEFSGTLEGLGLSPERQAIVSAMSLPQQQQYALRHMDQEDAERRAQARAGAAAARAAAKEAKEEEKARLAREGLIAALGPRTTRTATPNPSIPGAGMGMDVTTTTTDPSRSEILSALLANQSVPVGMIDKVAGIIPEEKAPSSVREYEYARRDGFAGTFEDWRTAGRPQTNVNVTNTGPERGRYLYAEDAGLDKGWRFDTVTQRAERIPGGPDDVEARQDDVKQSNKESQERLKLGTSLTSIGLNIDEIEDGGLPVTGPIGDFRRTGIGRVLTGSGAFDFENRTAQITDAAAFAEIQDMRDNSKTGGAVGQLTDKERAAIGNAVTALNSSTSEEEYLRAATAYRELALNLAYGEGRWSLNEDGTVSTDVPGSAETPSTGARLRYNPETGELE